MPDLRGLFLRGNGGNSAPLGIQQGDEIPELVARVGYYNGYDGVYMITKPYRFTPNLWAGNSTSWQTSAAPQSVCSAVVDRISGNTEIRPVNMAVRYLIRARP